MRVRKMMSLVSPVSISAKGNPVPLKVLIVIPCYNEEASLPGVLTELKNFVPPAGFEITPLVINDCSRDNTAAVAKDYGAVVLSLTCNLGIGGAVQTGFQYAKANDYDLAVQVDGDGQHPPAELTKILEAYRSYQSDVIIGSRFLEFRGFQSSPIRRAGIMYFYRLNKVLTGNPVYDSTSGFRLLSRKAFSIAAKNYPDDYPEPESLVIFGRKKLSIREIPVVMRERSGGQSSIGRSSSLYYCIKVSIAMLFSFIRA
jgi:glycosyltransferase involved in cell wall biosynthesis